MDGDTDKWTPWPGDEPKEEVQQRHAHNKVIMRLWIGLRASCGKEAKGSMLREKQNMLQIIYEEENKKMEIARYMFKRWGEGGEEKT